MNKYVDVVVIGGGAAGLMCASIAGQRGRACAVLEQNERVGKKILISGGGRCNFTNLYTDASNFLSRNVHFCKSALSRYTPYHFIELLNKYSIPFHEKTLGQQFCDHSAQDIVDVLLAECKKGGVKIKTNTPARAIQSQGDGFLVSTPNNTYRCESLVIATGGLSFPRLGASDYGLGIAKQFDIPLTPIHPALVPFTMSAQWREKHEHLSGLSIPARVHCIDTTFEESILFTHKGFSGPAILQISSYWQAGQPIVIDLLPSHKLTDILHQAQSPKLMTKNLLTPYLPKRFINHLCADYPQLNKTLAELSNQGIEELHQAIHQYTFTPAGTEGYKKAEVTLGGVDTHALSSKTMASLSHPNLFFIGEVVDVTGHLGGFNFQWAWASGYCAGQYV